MDSKSIVQIISAIAWPFTVIIIAFMFRHEIKKTANRLSTFSYGEMKAEFAKDLNKLEKDMNELHISGESIKKRYSENDSEILDSYERLNRIAVISPRAAIMEAWRDIEVTTKQVAEAYGLKINGQIAGTKAITELISQQLLPKNVGSVYEKMRRLRSQAAHSVDFPITVDEAKRYIDTAYRFHNLLLFLLQQAIPSSEKNDS